MKRIVTITLLALASLSWSQTPAPVSAPGVQAAIHVVSPAIFVNSPVKPVFPQVVYIWMQPTNPTAGATYDFKVATKTNLNAYTQLVALDTTAPWTGIAISLSNGETFTSATVTLLTEGLVTAVTTVE